MYQNVIGGVSRASRTCGVASLICKYQPRVCNVSEMSTPAWLFTCAFCCADSVTPARMAPKFTPALIGSRQAASINV
ncbi:hypothetical protein D3C78_1870550 [compost metagenome]